MFDFLLACLMVTLFVLPLRIWFKVRWHRIPTEQLVAVGYPPSLIRWSGWLVNHPVVSWGLICPLFNLVSTVLIGGMLWLVGLGYVWVYVAVTVFDCASAHRLLSRKFGA